MPPFHTGESASASGSQDQPKHDDNPESSHEEKEKPGRPQNVKQYTKTKQARPKHDIEKYKITTLHFGKHET